MFPDETRVLIILPQELVDRARVFAGRATTTMKLAVSLQIVLRALIEEGLRQSNAPGLLANVARQAASVRRIRSQARRRAAAGRRAGPGRTAVDRSRRRP